MKQYTWKLNQKRYLSLEEPNNSKGSEKQCKETQVAKEMYIVEQ